MRSQTVQSTYYPDKMEGRDLSILRWENRSRRVTHEMTRGEDEMGLGG